MGAARTDAGEQAAEVVREMARRFAAGDREGAVALFHPGVRVQQPASLPHGGWYHGRDGVDTMGRRFARYWDRTIGEARVLGCGETVVQVTRQTWTARVTGRSATVDVAELITVAGGQVTQIRVFQQDTHLLLTTLQAGDRPGDGTGGGPS